MTTRADPLPVHFVVLPGVYLLDLAGIADAMRTANRLAERAVFDVRFHGVECEVTTSIGLPLGALQPLPDTLAEGALVVIAGVTPQSQVESPAAVAAARWLARTWGDRQRLACVCAGAFLAGSAGLLDGRRCTTHHEDCDELQRRHPKALVQSNRIFVQDGNLMTSAGVTAGIDLALQLIAEHAGPTIAVRVARALVVYVRRAGSDPQLSPWFAHRNHLHPVVHRAQDAIVVDPARDWNLDTIAAASLTSARHLSRLFRDELGVTVLGYLQHVRIAVARERLETTALSIEQVAEAAGFSSAHQLRRVWRRHASTPPNQGRASAARPP